MFSNSRVIIIMTHLFDRQAGRSGSLRQLAGFGQTMSGSQVESELR